MYQIVYAHIAGSGMYLNTPLEYLAIVRHFEEPPAGSVSKPIHLNHALLVLGSS